LILLIKTPRFTSMVVTLVDLLAITYLNGDKRPVFCTPCGGWPNGLDCNKLTRTLAFYKAWNNRDKFAVNELAINKSAINELTIT
jgi:hypothetical protein